MRLTPLPPSSLPLCHTSYHKFLSYSRFEPLVVGIQENLICPPLLPINLDEDRRVGTSFLQVGRPDPQGPWEFCRDRSSCTINFKSEEIFKLPVGKTSKSKVIRTEVQIVYRCVLLSETHYNKYSIWEVKDSLLFERVCLNVPFNGESLLVCFKLGEELTPPTLWPVHSECTVFNHSV